MRKLAIIAGLALGESLVAVTFAQGQPHNPPPAGASYVLKVEAPPAKKGQKSVAKVKITPAAGYHMNKEYPTSLVLSSVPSGVMVDKMKWTMKDAAKWEEAEG